MGNNPSRAHPSDQALVPTASSQQVVSTKGFDPSRRKSWEFHIDEYRGWKIYFEPPPIPLRQFDYQASDPNGDGEPNAYGRTREECRAGIDRILEEREDEQ